MGRRGRWIWKNKKCEGCSLKAASFGLAAGGAEEAVVLWLREGARGGGEHQ
jgi:hypothetical protein